MLVSAAQWSKSAVCIHTPLPLDLRPAPRQPPTPGWVFPAPSWAPGLCRGPPLASYFTNGSVNMSVLFSHFISPSLFPVVSQICSLCLHLFFKRGLFPFYTSEVHFGVRDPGSCDPIMFPRRPQVPQRLLQFHSIQQETGKARDRKGKRTYSFTWKHFLCKWT